MKVRAAESSDIPTVLAIQAGWPSLPAWTEKQFREELGSARSVFAVIEDEGRVSGYGIFLRAPEEARIVMVAVARGRAGHGLGRLLLSRLIDDARASGCRTATLEVSAVNTAAARLYASSGFRVVGRRQKFYNDGSDAVLMDLKLR